MQLTTLDDVNAWLKLPSGHADEPLLSRLIAGASGFIETWCSRSFDLQQVTEVRDGTGGSRLSPFLSPVVQVTSVMIGSVIVPPIMLPATSAGWFFANRQVQLLGYCFERGQGNVLLSYTAGYLEAPDDLQQAAIELVCARYRERDRIGMSSTHAAGETTSYSLKDMPPQVATLLSQYKRVVPA
jgi:hypothetical protein